MSDDKNALIGRWAGHKPRVSWEVVNAEGNATCYSANTEQECRDWIDGILFNNPDSWIKDRTIAKWEQWPLYDCCNARAIELLPELVERGYSVRLESDLGWNFTIWQDVDDNYVAKSWNKPKISEAITDAILQLMDKQGPF